MQGGQSFRTDPMTVRIEVGSVNVGEVILCDVSGMAPLSHPLPIINLGTCSDMRRSIAVNDRMQQDYRYERVEPVGRNFDPEFKPDRAPAEMLRLGVFSGKYMTDCCNEFPASWFKHAKLAS